MMKPSKFRFQQDHCQWLMRLGICQEPSMQQGIHSEEPLRPVPPLHWKPAGSPCLSITEVASRRRSCHCLPPHWLCLAPMRKQKQQWQQWQREDTVREAEGVIEGVKPKGCPSKLVLGSNITIHTNAWLYSLKYRSAFWTKSLWRWECNL